jgi:hypothetical protein
MHQAGPNSCKTSTTPRRIAAPLPCSMRRHRSP